jgi:hypothetical protein
MLSSRLRTLFQPVAFSHPSVFLGLHVGLAVALPLFVGWWTDRVSMSVLPALAAFFITVLVGSVPGSFRDKAGAGATVACAGVLRALTELVLNRADRKHRGPGERLTEKLVLVRQQNDP